MKLQRNPMTSLNRTSGLLALALLAGWADTTMADDFVLRSAGNWSTATWQPSAPPSGGDATVTIFSGVTGNQSYTNDLGSGPDLEFVLNSVVWSAGGPLFAGQRLAFVPNDATQPTLVYASTNTPNRAFPIYNDIRIADGATLTINGNGSDSRGAGIGTGYILLGAVSGAADIVVNATVNPDDVRDHLTLSASNSFTGSLTINQGVVTVSNQWALGTTAGATVVANGAQLRLGADQVTLTESISISGNGQGTSGAINHAAGTNTLAGAITVTGSSARIRSGAGMLTISGGVTSSGANLILAPQSFLLVTNNPINLGAGALQVHGTNVVDLAVGGNTFGELNVAWGSTVRLQAANGIPAGAALSMGQLNNAISSVGTLDLNGRSVVFGSLNSQGGFPETLLVTSTEPATLTVDNPSDSTYAGKLAGAGVSLIKTNFGALTLTGSNSYGGFTTIGGGKLSLANVSHAGGGLITLGEFAELEVRVTSVGLSLPASSLVVNGGSSGTLTFDMGIAGNPTAPVMAVTNLTTSGSITVNLAGSGLALGQFTLITNYSGTIGGSGFGAFSLGAVPSGITALLTNVNNSLVAVITSADGYLWTGAANGDWDYSSLNWTNEVSSLPSAYADGQTTRFTDGAVTGNINLAIGPAPAVMIVDNTSLNYRVSGGSSISTSLLRKEGPGSLTLATDFINPITTMDINDGSVILDHPFDGSLTTVLTDNTGTSGTLVKTNTAILILSANNSTYDGAIRVAQGTLRAGVANVLGSTNGSTTVADGATFDVNNLNMGTEPVIASGAGVGGAGALIDGTAGTAVQAALQNVTLVGDTTIGGPGRWDMRAATATDPGLKGNGYKLIKVGTSWIAIAGDNGAVWNTDLGDIEVREGTLSVESGANVGRSTNNLVVLPGAMFVLFNTGVSNVQVKNLFMTNTTMRLSGPTAGGGAGTFGGAITLSGSNRFEVLNQAVHSFTNEVRGDSVLVKTSTGATGGTLTLSASNSYTGLTLIEANGTGTVGYNGRIRIRNAHALGTTDAGTIVQRGGSLELDGPLGAPLLEPLDLAGGGGDASPGALNNVAGDNTIGAPILLSNPGTGTRIANHAPDTVLTIDVPSGNAVTTVGESNALWISGNSTVAINDPVVLGTGDVRVFETATLWLNSTVDQPVTTDQGTLGGTGTINNTVTISGGTLAPGTSVGTLTINGDLWMTNNAVFEINKSAPTTNDLVVVSGALNVGGTLVVTNIGPALVTGEVFKLFSQPVSGTFTTLVLPPLDGGLSWDNQLATDGTLKIIGAVASPEFNPPAVAGGNLILTGTGGTEGTDYYLLTATNVTLPLASWEAVTTNQFGVGGVFSNAVPVTSGEHSRFFRLQVP